MELSIKKSLHFFIVALASSIILAGIASLFFSYKPILVLLYSLGVFMAFLIFKGKIQFEKHASSIPWILIGCILPILYVGLVYFLGFKFFDHKIQTLSLTFLSVLPLVLISSFFEEVGWRGFLFDMLKKIGWIRMNLFIGILWAVWHYPAIFIGSYDVTSPLIIGIAIFTLNVVLLSFIFSWFRQKTDGVIIHTVMHASHNLSYAYWAGTNDLSILSESGLVFTAVLLIVAIILRAWREPVFKS